MVAIVCNSNRSPDLKDPQVRSSLTDSSAV